MAVKAAFECFVFGSRHDFFISDFLPFSQSRLSNQFLTCEDGDKLISFTTWAWVWRGIHIVNAFIILHPCVAYARDTVVDVLVIPSTCICGRDIVIAPLVIPRTCIRERDIVITLLVIPSTCNVRGI